MSSGRYNSFEDSQLDVKFADMERRLRNLESLAGASSATHSQMLRFVPGGTTNVTSLTYVNVTSFALTYTKLSRTSLLRIDIRASGLVNVTNTEVDFGVDLTGPTTSIDDTDVCDFNYDVINDRKHFSGVRYIPDPGTPMESGLITVQVVVKVSGNQFTYDNDDVMTLEVSEVLPS